jgi:hypothetical protein
VLAHSLDGSLHQLRHSEAQAAAAVAWAERLAEAATQEVAALPAQVVLEEPLGKMTSVATVAAVVEAATAVAIAEKTAISEVMSVAAELDPEHRERLQRWLAHFQVVQALLV